MRFATFIILTLLASSIEASDRASIFVGAGPDPACGGTELRMHVHENRVVRIEHTIYQSFRSVDEHYDLLPNGDWRVTLLFYSSRWQRDEPLTRERLARKIVFRASAAADHKSQLQELGYRDTDWAAEPQRFIQYFHEHRAEFSHQKTYFATMLRLRGEQPQAILPFFTAASVSES